MKQPTISIAMCTFNGAAWVEEQLQSFVRQERLPDELIICDDSSSDSTCDILRTFADCSPFPVRLVQNNKQIGVTRNFSQAIELCTGDFIALSDQDDRWGPQKLQILEERLLADPAIGLVFSDANLVDAAMQPLHSRLWDQLYLDPTQRQRLTNGQAVGVLARVNVITGATMMFRSRFKEIILPISPHWIHDGWIALVVLAMSQCGMVDHPLIDYRQHPRQQIGAGKNTFLQQVRVGIEMDTQYFRTDMERWEDAYKRLSIHQEKLRSAEDLKLLADKMEFSRERYQMRLDPPQRWDAIGQSWWGGRYQKMAWGWKSLLQDVAIIP